MSTTTNKTLADIKLASPMNPDLIEAIVEQFGGLDDFLEDYESVALHGLGGGYGKFIWNEDNYEFYRKNQSLIVSYVENLADEMGDETFDVVKRLDGVGTNFTLREISKTLYTDKYDDQNYTLTNGLVWLVAEQLCHDLFDSGYGQMTGFK